MDDEKHARPAAPTKAPRRRKTTTTVQRQIVDLTDESTIRPPDPVVASRLMGTPPPRADMMDDDLEDVMAHSLRQFQLDQKRRQRQIEILRAAWTDNGAVLREATRRLSWAQRFPRDGEELEATETFQRIVTRFEDARDGAGEAWSQREGGQVARQMVRIFDSLPAGLSSGYAVCLRVLDALMQTYPA